MDDISTGTLLIFLGVLVLISAFFSSSETGMMSLNKYRLRHLVTQKNRNAMRVHNLLSRPDRLIGLILIGNNLVNILAASIATTIGMRLFGHLGLGVATAITTVALTTIILIFAEVTPKTLAAWFPERIAYPAAIILKPLMWVFYPFVLGLNAITNGILKLFRVKPDDNGQVLNQEELRTVVNEAGTMIPRQHQDMLLSILDLEKVAVEDVMVPRNEILGIDINDEWADIVKQLYGTKHTRLLLYRDTVDDAVGYIHARDVLRLTSKKKFSKDTLLRAAKKLVFVPEGTPLNTQLLHFQRKNYRFALVVDEYGDIQGLLTLEDILVEIVGDFENRAQPGRHEDYRRQVDNSYLVEGSANVRDLAKDLGWKLPIDGPRTINGLILEYLEEIPQPNVSIKLYGYPVDIVEVTDNAIKQVRVHAQLYKKMKSSK
ncbi:magnesium/cobalt efflux protein [Saccharobesus litoralis]|uniref:Magnesium/cobalt efflux protein n=1 Tax=Saccharobesus litoralis TaxID=2172099 RepID=A0A2S0VVB2_9ALTE|nr:HlyC/CorC family transporter [Saccharobesus litoralis]AWB68040.1 magnesium/cobalt efflux protein [Saccharobesus litoralis]